MKPAPFDYHAPRELDEALGLLAEHGADAKALAGGQSLVPMLAIRLARFEHLVDLNDVAGLGGIEVEGERARLGAMTRQADVAASSRVATTVPLLAEATQLVGHFQIRNRGTIGGSLAHADPAAEYPAVARALDAELQVVGPKGARSLPAADFFLSSFETALAPDELLVAVEFPCARPGCGFAIEETARRHGDFAVAGAACSLTLDSTGAVVRAAIALFGVAPVPLRCDAAEAALVGATPADIAGIARLATEHLDPPGDVHADATSRRHLATVMVERALQRALSRAADD